MIVRPAELYAKTAEAHGLTQELVASVGAAVLGRLMDVMVDPKELAYELDHVGTFHVRHLQLARKMKRSRALKDETFVQRFTHLEDKIVDFKKRKEDYKKIKHDYRQAKANQSSQS